MRLPMKVFPVHCWAKKDPEPNAAQLWVLPQPFNSRYIIVAESEEAAKEIAFRCAATSLYPQPEANSLGSDIGEKFVDLRVDVESAADTMSSKKGLCGHPTDQVLAKMYARFIFETDEFP